MNICCITHQTQLDYFVRMLLRLRLRQKVLFVLSQRDVLDDNATIIFDSKVRTTPMVLDGKMLGSGCEIRRISSSQDFGCSIILKDSANGGILIASLGSIL